MILCPLRWREGCVGLGGVELEVLLMDAVMLGRKPGVGGSSI